MISVVLYFSPEDYLRRSNNRRVNSRQLINKKQQTKMNQSRGRFEATKQTFHQPKEKELKQNAFDGDGLSSTFLYLNYVSHPISMNRFSWTYKLTILVIITANISSVHITILRFLNKYCACPNQILRPGIICMHMSV